MICLLVALPSELRSSNDTTTDRPPYPQTKNTRPSTEPLRSQTTPAGRTLPLLVRTSVSLDACARRWPHFRLRKQNMENARKAFVAAWDETGLGRSAFLLPIPAVLARLPARLGNRNIQFFNFLQTYMGVDAPDYKDTISAALHAIVYVLLKYKKMSTRILKLWHSYQDALYCSSLDVTIARVPRLKGLFEKCSSPFLQPSRFLRRRRDARQFYSDTSQTAFQLSI